MSDTAATICFLVTFAAIYVAAREMVEHARTRRMLRHALDTLEQTRQFREEADMFARLSPMPEWYRRDMGFDDATDRSE